VAILSVNNGLNIPGPAGGDAGDQGLKKKTGGGR
jgi:hypothetical protein